MEEKRVMILCNALEGRRGKSEAFATTVAGGQKDLTSNEQKEARVSVKKWEDSAAECHPLMSPQGGDNRKDLH